MRWLPALLVALALALGGCGGSSTLTKHGLQKQTETIQSIAAEGAMLAGQVARGRTTEPFARIHSGALAEQAKSAATTLHDANAPGHEADRRKALEDALGVQRELGRLHAAPTDRELAKRVERELERFAQ